MSSDPADNPSDKPGRFDSPVPDSWGQPAPDSWASGSWPPQSWPAQSSPAQPSPGQADGSGAPPPWPGQQTPPPAAPGPEAAAAGEQSQFAQAGAGRSQSGQHHYPPQYGQYVPNGQHPPDGQHTPDGQFPPDGQYGGQWQYFSPPTARNNRAALAALICGIGQFLLGLTGVGNILLAIPAIICGAIALKQIRLRGERGHGMAVAGLVLGILGVVYFAIIIALIVVAAHVSGHSF